MTTDRVARGSIGPRRMLRRRQALLPVRRGRVQRRRRQEVPGQDGDLPDARPDHLVRKKDLQEAGKAS